MYARIKRMDDAVGVFVEVVADVAVCAVAVSLGLLPSS